MVSQDVEVLLTQAKAALKTGNVQQARNLVKDILALDKRNVEAWLLATYLTNDPVQQRKFLDSAKQIAPEANAVRKRERELFPPKAHGVFVPDTLQAQPTGASPRRTTDHIPTFANAVELHPVPRLLALLPWCVTVGTVVAIMLFVFMLGTVFQTEAHNSPSDTVRRFYPAVKARDNTALSNLMSDDAKALCGMDLVQCIDVPLDDFQGYSIAGENLSTDTAIVRLDIQLAGNAGDKCQDFLVIDTNQGWRIQKDLSGFVACTSPMALLPGQLVSVPTTEIVLAGTPTLDHVEGIDALATQQQMRINDLATSAQEGTATTVAYHQTQTATAEIPTGTAISVQAITGHYLTVGQVWQGEAIENGSDHYPMSLKVIQLAGNNITLEITWTSFNNTITQAKGNIVVDWGNSATLDSWKHLQAFDPSTAKVGLQFTESSYMQGNSVKLGITYLAVTTDGKTLAGSWDIIGSKGVFSLTLQP